ncbi:MAG TPA: enoyl-CoA hydratase/isomerase family protein [Syntrophales bacterium]|nr:enoyl-CoA hydratase/isomerase family protein [Syntrophales bacterium]HOL59238.1 enoyl-CoA hydratase/isomerase family protein [Syntrophales bacterium]HPO35288.1 enoyl-CoA hydratase/isomerase family protein [Syntrophales bacterium]
MSSILVEKKTGYAIVTMNRPREMNALSREMLAELYEAITLLEGDRDIRAIIVTGGDQVFCAGMDIKELSTLPDEEIPPFFDLLKKCFRSVYTCRKPTIAAVGGIALGGGFNLATLCDLIVASESAIFGHPELRFGLNPLFHMLRDLVGMAKAKELTMIGEPIGAREAYRIGLVARLCTPEEFMAEAVKLAERLAEKSEGAIYAVKKMSEMTPHLDKGQALELEFDMTRQLFSSTERKLRMSEFLTREMIGKLKKR